MLGCQQILLDRRHAAATLSMGVRTFDRLRAAGRIGPREINLGGGVYFDAAELALWARSATDGELPDRETWLTNREGAA